MQHNLTLLCPFVAAFFQATQFFFTLCFIGMLIAIVFIVMYLLCINEYYRVSVLRWTGIDLIVSGALGTIALIIFGVKGGFVVGGWLDLTARSHI